MPKRTTLKIIITLNIHLINCRTNCWGVFTHEINKSNTHS